MIAQGGIVEATAFGRWSEAVGREGCMGA